MKEKVVNFLKSKWLFAVVLNAVILFFCVAVSSFSYENFSDYQNSILISNFHYYYNNNINYILCILIGSVQFILRNFNCYVLALVMLSWASFTGITYVFADKFSKKTALFFSLILNVLFALNHYADVESSKTAAILLGAGFLMALNAIRNKSYKLPFIIGVSEILLGSFLDYKYFFLVLGFAFAYFLADMISKRKYKIAFRKFFWYFRPFLLVFAFVSLLAVSLNYYSFSVNNSSAETSSYYTYSQLTDSIGNLPYPNYSENAEEFKAVGITSKNDYEMLKKGYYDSSTSLNNKALELVKEIQQKNNTKTIWASFSDMAYHLIEHIYPFDDFALIVIMFVILAVVFIVYQKRRFSFFPIFLIITAIISSTLLRYFYAIKHYNIYGIWLIMFTMLLFSFDFSQRRPINLVSRATEIKHKIPIATLVIAVLLGVFSFAYQISLPTYNKSDRPGALFSEINKHPERYYVLDPETAVEYMKHTDNFRHPMWGFNSNFVKNIDSFGYLHKRTQLMKKGLPQNIYKAVIDSKKVFVIDKSIVFKKEEYLNKYYSGGKNNISYHQQNDIKGYKIYSVSAEYLGS